MMELTTLGYASIRYTFDDAPYFRVSTLIKKGEHVNQFIKELEDFVYTIELKNPISLDFSVFVGSFINNKSDNVVNLNLKVI